MLGHAGMPLPQKSLRFPWNKFDISSVSSKNVILSSQMSTFKIALKTEEQTAWFTSRT
jgi:hypothetical protein